MRIQRIFFMIFPFYAIACVTVQIISIKHNGLLVYSYGDY